MVAQALRGSQGAAASVATDYLSVMLALLALACAVRMLPSSTDTPRLVAARAPEQAVVLPYGAPQDRVRIVIRAGSAYDPPGREGLAYVTARTIARRLAAEVEIGEEIVRFEVPAERASEVVAALTEPADADGLRKAAAEAAAWVDGADCATLAAAAWDVWAYPGHPYGHAVRGRTGVVGTFTRAELAAFLARRYVRESVLIGVPTAGNDVGDLTRLPDRMSPQALPAPSRRDGNAGRTLVVLAPVEQGCAVSGARRTDLPSPRFPDLLGPALAGAPMAELLAEGRTLEAGALPVDPSDALDALRAAAPAAPIVAVVPASLGLVHVPGSEETGLAGVHALVTAEDFFR